MPTLKSFKELNEEIRKGEHFKTEKAISATQRGSNGCIYCGHYHTLLQCLKPVNASRSGPLPSYRDSLWDVFDTNSLATEWKGERVRLTIEELEKRIKEKNSH